MSWGAVAVAGVSAAYSGYKAIKANNDNKKAKSEGDALRRPSYQIPVEDIQNRNIAAGLAQGGLSVDEKGYLQEERNRGLGTSLEALREGGGGVNDFARINSIFDDSLKSQAAMDAQQHLQNIQFFTKANQDVAAQRTTQWGINELQPYESKLKEIQDRRIAAQTNLNNAVDEGIGSASAAVTSYNSRNPNLGGKTKQPPNASPYTRTFGLENTGGVAGSPAAGVNQINPNVNAPINGGLQYDPNYPMPDFSPDDWQRMKQQGWDEGINVDMWNNKGDQQ